MLDIRVNGSSRSVAEVIRSARDVPARVIPYAASTAMTRVARLAATQDLPAAMRASFDRPTRWTLNSLRVEPATKDKLVARVHVKNEASSGVPQENYLLPGVEGGGRREKAFERALRYAGVLGAGERVMPGRNISLDANGNIPSGLIREVNTWAKSGAAKRTKASGRGAKRVKGQNPRGYFLFGKPGGTRGVAQRSGSLVLPVLIFTQRQPQYRPRLDFTGVAEQTALKHFGPEFARAAADILSRAR
jgi:hypothetical protein